MVILLVEPDLALAKIYEQLLQHKGHDVVIATSAQEAIIQSDIKTPDLLICELQLICHSGIELLYEFRSYPEWQKIPVIIHSTVPYAEFSGSRYGLTEELGISSYLYKPNTNLRQLLSSVEEVLLDYESA